jgi:hypothetical protein
MKVGLPARQMVLALRRVREAVVTKEQIGTVGVPGEGDLDSGRPGRHGQVDSSPR